MWSSI